MKAVSNFEGENFSGPRPVNLVEIYADVIEEDVQTAPLRSRKSSRKDAATESHIPAVFRYLNLGPPPSEAPAAANDSLP